MSIKLGRPVTLFYVRNTYRTSAEVSDAVAYGCHALVVSVLAQETGSMSTRVSVQETIYRDEFWSVNSNAKHWAPRRWEPYRSHVYRVTDEACDGVESGVASEPYWIADDALPSKQADAIEDAREIARLELSEGD